MLYYPDAVLSVNWRFCNIFKNYCTPSNKLSCVFIRLSLHGRTPLHLADEFFRLSDLEARGRLRSAPSPWLSVRRIHGCRLFPVAADHRVLERTSTPRHVCAVPGNLLQSSKDSHFGRSFPDFLKWLVIIRRFNCFCHFLIYLLTLCVRGADSGAPDTASQWPSTPKRRTRNKKTTKENHGGKLLWHLKAYRPELKVGRYGITPSQSLNHDNTIYERRERTRFVRSCNFKWYNPDIYLFIYYAIVHEVQK